MKKLIKLNIFLTLTALTVIFFGVRLQAQIPYYVHCYCDLQIIPDDDDCSIFYVCEDMYPKKYECAEGLHFNRDFLTCDWAWNVNCGCW